MRRLKIKLRVYSSITRPSMPLTLSPKPEISASVNIQSPRAISNKKVWFPADNVSGKNSTI